MIHNLSKIKKASIVVAVDENWAIGGDNKLLWHIPADLKRFKSITMGHPIIMGRKTYESIGRPLPGRKNIVITRNVNWAAEGVITAHSLMQAFDFVDDKTNSFIIGGGEIYRQALPYVQKVFLTKVCQKTAAADTWFPEMSDTEWHRVQEQNITAAEGCPAYHFIDYQRV